MVWSVGLNCIPATPAKLAHRRRKQTMKGSHPRRLQLGFTLVELLVTMALLSILMLGMASALRTMAQTEERVDTRLTETDEFRVATGFFANYFGPCLRTKESRSVGGRGQSLHVFRGARCSGLGRDHACTPRSGWA